MMAAIVLQQSVFDPAGAGAERLAWLGGYLIVAGSLVALFVLAILVLGLRRRGRGELEAPPEKGIDDRVTRRWVLLGGGAMPAAVLGVTLIAVLATLAASGDDPAEEPPEIEVVGHQWWWEVRYPAEGIVTANEVHVPAGRRVRIQLTSADVIHSFWVPRLHGKTDLIPGKRNQLVLGPLEPGVYGGKCAEYCGMQHAHMELHVVAHPPAEMEAWVRAQRREARAPADPLAAAGARAFHDNGCGFCHTVRGTAARGNVGPDLTHVGSRRSIAAGLLPNTQAAMGGWIANPQVLKPGVRMPPFALPGPELRALSAYLEGLK